MTKLGMLFGMAVAAAVAGCGSTPTLPTPGAKAELAPTGALRIAVFTGNPVIGSKSPTTGEVIGTTAILGRELAQRAGLAATLIEYTAVARIVEDAKDAAAARSFVDFLRGAGARSTLSAMGMEGM